MSRTAASAPADTTIDTSGAVPGADAAVWRLAIISICLSLGALIVSEALGRRASADRRSGHVL